MSTTNISPEMQAAVGREISRTVSHPVGENDIRRWALAVYWPEEPPSEFVDADVAAASQYKGLVALEEFNPFAWSVAQSELAGSGEPVDANNPDNTELQMGIPAPGLKYQLNGGMECEYGVRIKPGDVITAVRTLASYTEREGRLGLMLFTRFEELWTNQDGEMVKKTATTLIRY